MFTTDADPVIDGQITKVLVEMDEMGVAAPEYPNLMTYLERLYELKAKTRTEPLSRETMAMVFGNLAGILLIVAYEQKHVLTSKAINQVGRLKS